MHEQKSSLQHTRGILMFNPKSYSTATAETRQQQQSLVMAQRQTTGQSKGARSKPTQLQISNYFTNCQDMCWRNDELENKSWWENWISMCEKIKLDPSLCTKILT